MRSSLRFPSQSVDAFSSASQPVTNRSPGTALPRRRIRPVLAAPTHPPAPSFAFSIEAVSSSARPLGRSRGQLLGVALQGIHCPAHVRHPRDAPLRASSSGLILALLGAVLGLSAYYTLRAGQSPPQDIEHLSERLASMTTEIGPGRPGNLTPEEEEKLRRLWQLIFQVCRVGQEQNGAGRDNDSGAANDKAQDADTKKVKKSRMSIFSRKGRKDSDADSASGASANAPVLLNLNKDGDADKYGQTKQFYDALASQSAESIRDTIWSMVKHDHPDALVLRFLRARKWDVERALIMLVSTMHWRAQEMKLDEDIMRNGEAAALAAEKNSDPAARRLGHDFMVQIRKGISYVHGVDKQGRPLCFVNVRLHRQGEQAEESLERYTVYLIETCRMLLQPPVDTATVVFDMTNFSMANMDYTPVRFMIKCFEANYPECLGTVLVHKAPWIFQGIWKIIRGWLDPVVANKVHFTNNAQEMEEFIPLRHIPKDLEGEENWTYEYVEPRDGENDKLNDTETRDRLLEARAGLFKEYEEATLEWIQNPEGDKAAEIKARRNEIASKLRDDYWTIDPYVRACSYYDRIGVIRPGGTLNWYPEEKEGLVNGAAAAAAVAAPAAPETSPDDVD